MKIPPYFKEFTFFAAEENTWFQKYGTPLNKENWNQTAQQSFFFLSTWGTDYQVYSKKCLIWVRISFTFKEPIKIILFFIFNWNERIILFPCRLFFTYFFLPETENRTLEDIELHFSQNDRKLTDIKIKKNSSSAGDVECGADAKSKENQVNQENSKDSNNQKGCDNRGFIEN